MRSGELRRRHKRAIRWTRAHTITSEFLLIIGIFGFAVALAAVIAGFEHLDF